MKLDELWWPVRRLLDRHLGRLRDNLEVLSERLREALANTVGKAVADAVREVVHRLVSLSPTPADPRPMPYQDQWERDQRYESDEPYEPSWRRNDYDGDYDDEPEEPLTDGPDAQASPTRWLRAIQLGLQTAAWLVRSRLTQLPLASALGLGVFASAAACVSGPSVITIGASIVAGILSLLNLIDSSAAVAARQF